MNYPKGYLIAIGGGEDKGLINGERQKIVRFEENGILKTLVDLIEKVDTPKIALVTTASSLPDEKAKQYKAAFRKLACKDVEHLKINTREEADDAKIISRLHDVNCVFFTGGDQTKLCSTLGGTNFVSLLKQRYNEEPFFIAGSSAGAAAMSNTIISSGDPTKGYRKGQVKFSIGFGFISDAIIDTHFDERGRLARLLQAIAYQPGINGIGLGEDTGVVVQKGHILKVIGSGTAVILSGNKLTYNNLHELQDGAPITLENVMLHTLSNSDIFDLQTKELKPVMFKAYEK
jgi:cyanophycinase